MLYSIKSGLTSQSRYSLKLADSSLA